MCSMIATLRITIKEKLEIAQLDAYFYRIKEPIE